MHRDSVISWRYEQQRFGPPELDIHQRFKNIRGFIMARNLSMVTMIIHIERFRAIMKPRRLSKQHESLHISDILGRRMPSLSNHFNKLEELCLGGVEYAIASNV